MSERIIVQELHGHWSAWWEHTPQIAFGEGTPAEAMDRLNDRFQVLMLPWGNGDVAADRHLRCRHSTKCRRR